MKVTPHRYRSNALDRDAYMRGRDDAMAGLERFPQCQHPNQYGAYNAGFYDWHKLQAFSAMLAALKGLLSLVPAEGLRPASDPDWQKIKAARAAIAKAEGRDHG